MRSVLLKWCRKKPASDNDWEAVKRGRDAFVQRWIDAQLQGRSYAVVRRGIRILRVRCVA